MSAKVMELYRELAKARRSKGLTQSELARLAECKQSAVSMMERGRGDALSRQKLAAVAEVLGVDAARYLEEASPDEGVAAPTVAGNSGICPVFDCPSNIPYIVNGRMLVLPRSGSAGSGRHCAYCGELLERQCPECGAAVAAGRACCGECGEPYVAVPESPEAGSSNWAEWSDRQRARLAEIGII